MAAVRALVIQHDHVCLPGIVGERFVERGYDLVVHQVVGADRFASPDVQSDFPAPEEFDVIVAMGAPWSAYDNARVGRWVLPELGLLRRADERAVPVFGICFGGQLLALAHGGEVSASSHPELGWVEVESDDETLVPGGRWFEWHGDRWTLPRGATEIARNEASSQAFVLRRNLAVQFHPEMTCDIAQLWLDTGGDAELTSFDVTPESLLREIREHEATNRRRASRLVDAFLDRVATVPA